LNVHKTELLRIMKNTQFPTLFNFSRSKGMTSVMSLIIGSAVIMMVGAILMMSSTDIIGDGLGGAQQDACVNAIEQACNSDDSPAVPASCSGLDSAEIDRLSGEDDDMQVQC